ncbi:MAG: hypothetical protein JW829_10925 [Pirellulales bacterium]|nr:hypothetical protein [Pirellulales bacterium]
MNRSMRNLSLLLIGIVLNSAQGDEIRREIHFPDILGYKTLVGDMHMHTVFSDGDVWPPVRVEESWRQGLDLMAITDHIEYLPHKDDLKADHNRSHELATETAAKCNMLLIRGAEITRDTPPGHFNAIFLRDVNPLKVPDFLEAIQRANEQGAFLFWNHQGWQGAERGSWRDVHTKMYENGWLHGMEVCNGPSYYPDAHRWCLEKNLTMLGNSDIHDPDLRKESMPGDHRTMTLVFVKERSVAGVQEALKAGRTAVWYQDQLIGRSEYLAPLLDASVQIDPPHFRSGNHLWLEVRNASHVPIRAVRAGAIGPAEAILPPRSTSLLELRVPKPDEPIDLEYTITNFLIAPEAGLPVKIRIP